MSEFTKKWQQRLLAAQEDLVDAAGGVARVMEVTGYSRGQVGRWHGGMDRAFMPIPVVLALEENRRPFVTQIMAEFNGRALTDATDRGERISNLSEQVADLVEQASHLVVQTVKARADGVVTPTEATLLRGISTKIASLNADIDDALAGVVAGGGLKVVGGE